MHRPDPLSARTTAPTRAGAVAAALASLSLALTACVSTPPGAAESGATGPGEASATVAAASETTPAELATDPAAAAPATPEATASAPAVDWTAGMPSDPVAAAAWEALMAPDGEYAAAAAYDAVLATFGADVEPYASIREAELRHIAALQRQLERLGVEVPADPWAGTIGAPDDLAAAAAAWAEGEVANIALYDHLAEAASSDERLVQVFGNLRSASLDKHLPAFEAAAANGGVSP